MSDCSHTIPVCVDMCCISGTVLSIVKVSDFEEQWTVDIDVTFV